MRNWTGWEMRNDRVLIERIEPEERIILTDKAKSQLGVVRAVGPGKWIEGYWGVTGGEWVADANGIHHRVGGTPKWFRGYRDNWGLQTGQRVLFNPRWDDLSEGYEHQGSGRMHLVQQADVFCVLNA